MKINPFYGIIRRLKNILTIYKYIQIDLKLKSTYNLTYVFTLGIKIILKI